MDDLRVLLVEDSASDAALISQRLEETGLRVETTTVRDLHRASGALTGGWYDCALVDLSLPDAHGLQAVDRLVADAPHVALIVLTGSDDHRGLGAEAVRHGAQDFITKSEATAGRLRQAISFATQRAQLTRLAAEQGSTAELELILHRLSDRVDRARAGAMEQMPRALTEIAGQLAQCRALLSERYGSDGTAVSRIRRAPLADVSERALVLLAEEVCGAGVVLGVHDLPTVVADADVMLEVMLHLLRHAIRAAAPPAEVWVTSTTIDGWADVVVGRSGQVEPGRRRLADALCGLDGHGDLGSAPSLEFCTNVIAGFGGELWTTSDEQGHPVVRFRLPAAEDGPI